MIISHHYLTFMVIVSLILLRHDLICGCERWWRCAAANVRRIKANRGRWEVGKFKNNANVTVELSR